MNSNMVGYRFSPTEEELINFYLKNKILGSNNCVVNDSISEVNICSYDPKFLPSLSKIESNDLVWYFFSPIEYTSTEQMVRKRTTPSGFWKRTGCHLVIKDKRGYGGEIGIVKVLVYVEGSSRRSSWVMKEYNITCLPIEQRTYVIFKLMYKGEGRDVLCGGSEVGNFPSGSNQVRNLPPSGGSDQMMNNRVGYRFIPTDEELINFYLKNKILGKEWLVDDAISEINIHCYEPKFLPSLSKIKSNDLVWYFFSPIEFTKKRPSRMTPSGFWKVTGVVRIIKDKGGHGGEIGILRTLVHREGRASRGGGLTPWVMYQYQITCLPPDQRTYVICKISYKGDDRDFPSGNNEVGIIPSGGIEVGNFSSAGNVVGNFSSADNYSSDLCHSFVCDSNSLGATSLTKIEKRQQKLPSVQSPVVDSNTLRAVNLTQMSKLLQNLPSDAAP